MTYATMGTGLWFPKAGLMGAAITTNIIDATAEKVALLGYCYIDGRPGSAKTISAAGGGSISFRLGTTTFANGSSTLAIGIQDMSASSPQQPDGSFDVSVTLTGSGLTTAAWNTISMTGGSGSKSIAHGDLIAIVFDFTNRAGVDSVIVATNATNNGWSLGQAATQQGLPGSNLFTAAWATGSTSTLPNAVITFDDGTIGMLDGGFPVTPSDTSYSNSSTPDEYCEIFQVPFDCKVDALFIGQGGSSATTSDFEVNLYSDPTGTPTSIMPGAVAKAVLAEQLAQAGSQASYAMIPLASEVSLSADTNYALGVKATGAGLLNLRGYTIPAAGSRVFLPGGTTLQSATRNDSTGAFGSASTTQHYLLAVRISSVELDSGGAVSSSAVNVVQANVGVLTNTIGY